MENKDIQGLFDYYFAEIKYSLQYVKETIEFLEHHQSHLEIFHKDKAEYLKKLCKRHKIDLLKQTINKILED